MQVRGITKGRNEAHILGATLDSWAAVCNGGIHVYCDACDDHRSTEEIARQHPAVVEVLASNLTDPNRERAEWFHRRQVLHSALRFLTPDDWVVYFDGDEHLERFDPACLTADLGMVACESYDVYITPEDEHLSEWDYAGRQWVSSEFQFSPYFYSCRNKLDFYKPDQRNIELPPGTRYKVSGLVRHWGKGLSVAKWEEKCRYYAETFGPKYAAKWQARHGQAVKADMCSDFGLPLVAAELASGALEQPFGPVLQGDGYHLVCPPERAQQPEIAALQSWLHSAAQTPIS